MLAACGTSQPPIGAPGAMPQSRGIATHVERGGSWMLPEPSRKSGDLIYVMGPVKNYIISYSTGATIATFDGPEGRGAGLCSDEQGHVFMPATGEIWEFKHGGTTPINKLKDSYRAMGCSIDPLTGDLAVANFEKASSYNTRGNIAIFEHGSGKPKFLVDPTIKNYVSCGYDAAGNLFLDGSADGASFLFAELPAGSSSFVDLSLNKPVLDPGSVQWDGRNIAVGVNGARLIYRVSASGSIATVLGTTRLDTINRPIIAFWVQGSTVMTASGATHKKVGLWDYPDGGKPVKQYGPISRGPGRLGGMTVSVAPSL